MFRLVVPMAALAAMLLSCGGGTAVGPEPAWAHALPGDLPLDGELLVRPEEREEPPLELRFPWDNPGSTLGWGAVHMWARPVADHVRVSAIVDSPAAGRRWRCDEVTLRFDAVERRIPAEYVGRPMRGGGSYDAVRLRIGVHHLRKLARARRSGVAVCGDELELTPALQRRIQRFVEWFDHLATPRRAGDMPYFRDVGPRPALPGDDDEPGPLES